MSQNKAKKLARTGAIIGTFGLAMVIVGIVQSRSVDFNPGVVLLWGIGGLLFFLGLSVFARGAAGLRSKSPSSIH